MEETAWSELESLLCLRRSQRRRNNSMARGLACSPLSRLAVPAASGHFRGLAPPGAPWDYAQRNLRFPDPKASRELERPGSGRATSRREKGSMRHEQAKRSPSLKAVTLRPKLWSCCFQWLSYSPQPHREVLPKSCDITTTAVGLLHPVAFLPTTVSQGEIYCLQMRASFRTNAIRESRKVFTVVCPVPSPIPILGCSRTSL